VVVVTDRVRKRVTGTSLRPRLVVSRSSRHVFVQVVDDTLGTTVASASTMEADLRSFDGGQDSQGTQSRRAAR
jgi:large subunit ribosomal protein L18